MKREAIVWIDDLLCDTISPENHRALQDLLKSDPAALRSYCQQADIHGRLEWELKQPAEKSPSVPPIGAPTFDRPRGISSRWISMAALLAILLGIGALIFRDEKPGSSDNTTKPVIAAPSNKTPPPGKLATDGIPLARLTKSRDAEWNHDAPHDGTWLKPGSLDLLSGSAEITMDSGARIILRGPAEFQLVNPYQANLTRGKASVFMPSYGNHFRLQTPTTIFERADSSFAVAVADDGTVEAHALEGLVEATPRANPHLARLLSQDETLLLSDKAIVEGREVRHAAGSFDYDLPVSLNAVPSLCLHWPLDEEQAGRTPETGNHEGPAFPARLLARPGTGQEAHAEFIKGKFGKALSLDGSGAFLASGFPGIAGSASRTVAFWVRIPKDSPITQAYAMVSWGAPQSQTGEKWQIAWNTQSEGVGVQGAIRTEFGGGWVIGETDLRDGRWHHVACVFLGGESVSVATHIRHYVDGKLEQVSYARDTIINTRLTIPTSLPTYFGRRLENDELSSGFNGDLDEIYIFPAALTPQQISALYQRNVAPKHFIPGF